VACIQTVSSATHHAFSISRRNREEIILSAASEVELQYWIAALSVCTIQHVCLLFRQAPKTKQMIFFAL
jgi:hypothetical protein